MLLGRSPMAFVGKSLGWGGGEFRMKDFPECIFMFLISIRLSCPHVHAEMFIYSSVGIVASKPILKSHPARPMFKFSPSAKGGEQGGRGMQLIAAPLERQGDAANSCSPRTLYERLHAGATHTIGKSVGPLSCILKLKFSIDER